jgi:hypothetical protein
LPHLWTSAGGKFNFDPRDGSGSRACPARSMRPGGSMFLAFFGPALGIGFLPFGIPLSTPFRQRVRIRKQLAFMT